MNAVPNALTRAAPSERLRNKTAIVTGAGSGIGRAAAKAYAREGAAVVLAGRREEELNQVAADIMAAGGKAFAVSTDIVEEGSIARLIAAAIERFGRLDVAFNNAGTNAYSPIEAAATTDFDHVMATNVRGVWLLMKYQIAAMRQFGRGGSIVNTSSIAATGGTAGLSIYAASKGALDAMIRPLALEVGGDGIRVNNVSPGVVMTPMTAGLPDEMLRAMAAHAALKRLGEPEDIADIAVWLSTDEARFITGQSLLADGGFNIAGAR